jgi:NAD(P)-dependent dehydrogenase (short-subunit alcohol dehydrogenase family)
MDLRGATNNELITAEHCDLASLHSIRLFATKWVDNAPPRRLDMIILCANTLTPAGGKPEQTEDGIEENWGLNYLANFHLLSILSPALRAQPPDRDVRVIFGMCASYMGGDLTPLLPEPEPESGSKKPSKSKSKDTAASKTSTSTPTQAIKFTPSTAHSTSKLALLTFASSFQKHLSSYIRPDSAPMNARVIVVDPGWTRTPGMRRYLTFGSLWGLLLYLLTWPLWWLILKSASQGAQSFLHAAMEGGFSVGLMKGEGDIGTKPEVSMAFVKECREVGVARKEVVGDEGLQRRLWEESERTIETVEKEGAVRRAKLKKEEEGKKKDSGKGGEEVVGDAKASGASVQRKDESRRSRKGVKG